MKDREASVRLYSMARFFSIHPPRGHSLRSLLLATCLCIAAAPSAHAQVTLVSFDFNNQSSATATLTASTLADHLSASLFSVSDGGFTSLAVTTGSPPDSPAIADSGAWNTSSPVKYFSFTLAPQPGYGFAVTSLSFDYRQTASGALDFQVDFGATANVISGTFLRDSAWHSLAFDLTLPTFVDPTEVRIYGFNGGTGSFGLDRVTLQGNVLARSRASVPESGNVALLMAAGFLLCVFVRRPQRT